MFLSGRSNNKSILNVLMNVSVFKSFKSPLRLPMSSHHKEKHLGQSQLMIENKTVNGLYEIGK